MKTFTRLLAMVSLTLLVAACGGDEKGPAQTMQANTGVPVDVAKVVSQRLTEWDNFTGRLESPHIVALRPRVSGYIDFVAFDEGEYVEQGQTLFLIDNRTFKAEVSRLTAQLEEAKSRVQLAEQNYNRAFKLRKTQAVSEEVLDARLAEKNQALASLNQTQAELDVARLNRGFARVEAPISGRISRANITEGNFVTAGQTELTRIVSTDRLYAYFDIDEQTYLNYLSSTNKASTAVSEQPVAMRLANESDYHHWGQIDFIDNQVNSSTGTLRVRAVFNNDEGRLIPGLFAHLKLAGDTQEQGILIKEKAIGTDLNNKFVLVVNEENKVEYRPVTLGDKVGSMRIIKRGLNANDSIVVDGLQRVRPGALVAANEVPMGDEDALANLSNWQSRVDIATELTQNMAQFDDVLAGGSVSAPTVTAGLK
ncbi:MAG TPA: efflux transporter periplasmic adaptor subunit [Alteromonas australica]|uniref:Efflux transporter periplasmic adaptor subunit n=1 Tax=Alteromonas australica TaxID=589873 RepID=A0A358DWM3_9ALTE|nr:efflux RND transporter periplasmic adaptor subunit [Alteromonas australica]MBU32698.1 efflux transporter periplasmic adaptor subunit [Alteromonas sp.]HAU26555.1 efflux transporter periplasmic adaptor subunit [Alteromonas australica]HAW76250.1 efflux transporter periplasmic adaptor subunit [Alteromonas australica]HBU50055.1 efflux transporter periplasmic adaptor subunit [Alteromonas australica]|tara:strand:+ start:2918 stop:4189 length:1272 start_codon:yes stop_codon:yes gene_type:complete